QSATATGIFPWTKTRRFRRPAACELIAGRRQFCLGDGAKPLAVSPPPNAPDPVDDPQAVATQKTAELAGLASPKPMPPATDGNRFQAAPEKNRPTHRRPRKLEKRCAIGFYFLLLSL